MENRFPAEYFENEVREGFFVPSMMKRAWAQELTVLGEIDRICSKYNIQYFAEWGTLLGAVRHAGFIPWDDDIDISMKRKDYEKFLEVADIELPRGYKINNLRNKKDFCLFLARVMNTSHISFDDDYLREHNEFPYIAGVDIFVMDWVSSDTDAEKRRDTVADYAITLADCIYGREMQFSQVMDGIKKLKNITGQSFGCDRERIRLWLDGENAGEIEEYITDVRQSMYMYAERLFDSFTEAESNELTQLFPFGLRNRHYRYPKEYYADAVRVPFEDTTIPVPLGYDKLLRMRYGDYMVVKKNRGGHGYPFYESQQEQLDKLAGVKLPRYEYTKKEAEYSEGIGKELNGEHSLKQIAKSVCVQLGEFDIPEEAQALAIQFGNFIEKNYSEHPAVHLLEEYCEQLYLYVVNGTGYDAIKNMAAEIYDKVNESKETVFIVSQPSKWTYIKPSYLLEKNKGTQIYIVVIPFYRKRFDGTLIDRQYKYQEFCSLIHEDNKNVHIVEYCDYDITLHTPDTIYIQNPYDEWNNGISVDRNYYTDKLIHFCKNLIYVPPFDLDDFSKNDYVSFKNMDEYVIVPGVVRADKVLVKSEEMRRTYIDKLILWSQHETYDIWDKKIIVQNAEPDKMGDYELKKEVFGQYKDLLLKADGGYKKVILYHNSVGIFLDYGNDAIGKIESVIDSFETHKKNIAILWYYNPAIDEELKKVNYQLLEKYNAIIREFMSKGIGIYDCTHSAEEVVNASDAYYGDIDRIARICERKNVQIMIENINC